MNVFKKLFCKHKNVAWLRLSPGFVGGAVKVPVRVCVDCQKLTWAVYDCGEVTFLNPQKTEYKLSPPSISSVVIQHHGYIDSKNGDA